MKVTPALFLAISQFLSLSTFAHPTDHGTPLANPAAEPSKAQTILGP